MKYLLNTDKSVFESLRHKPKDKANEVFLKLYIKQHGKKNPFDEIRSKTYPIQEDIKPGGGNV